jgi:hypothetical protein
VLKKVVELRKKFVHLIVSFASEGRALGWDWTTLDQVLGPLDHLGGAG